MASNPGFSGTSGSGVVDVRRDRSYADTRVLRRMISQQVVNDTASEQACQVAQRRVHVAAATLA